MDKAIMILEAEKTYLPTIYPARYYGAQDDKVYLIAKMPQGRAQIKFVIFRLKEFSYNFKKKILKDHKLIKKMEGRNLSIVTPLFIDYALNEPFQQMEEVMTLTRFRPINSFTAAEQALDKYIDEELNKHSPNQTKPPKE